MAFRRVVCGFGLQNPGCWVTRPLRRVRVPLRGQCSSSWANSLQDTELLAKPPKGPILERNGGSAIGPASLSATDVRKILTAYDMTMSWMQLLH
jgi:hypothetical protein